MDKLFPLILFFIVIIITYYFLGNYSCLEWFYDVFKSPRNARTFSCINQISSERTGTKKW